MVLCAFVQAQAFDGKEWKPVCIHPTPPKGVNPPGVETKPVYTHLVLPSGVKVRKEMKDIPVHKGVICDSCQNFVVGHRYKCG